MRFFDTHCHLAGDELLPQAEELAARAIAGKVEGMLIVAADAPSLTETPKVCARLRAKFPDKVILESSGIHPHEADGIGDELWAQVERQSATAAAIGETGLDYHYDHSDRGVQRSFFTRHIELAARLRKPLVIHCREAVNDVLELLDVPAVKNHPNPGILHCFTEDWPTAKRLLDLGFFISFSGIVSFRNAESLRKVAALVPPERLLIETDSPWLAPIPHRGKRNEPAFVAHTFEALRSLRPDLPDPEALAELLWRNSCRVFGVSA